MTVLQENRSLHAAGLQIALLTAPYRFRILTKCLVKRYRYTSEYRPTVRETLLSTVLYRTTVREVLLITYYKYAASQPAASQPAASCRGVVHKQYLPPRTALQVPHRTAVACQRGKVPRGQTQ